MIAARPRARDPTSSSTRHRAHATRTDSRATVDGPPPPPTSHCPGRAIIAADLAGDHLTEVTAPTPLIVGSLDATVLELNEQAQQQLAAPTELAVIRGATHLFEEPGALEQVADLATGWLLRHATE